MKIAMKREQRKAMLGYAERAQFGAKLKTKTIFNTLVLAMMLPAMMLTTACSSDDDIVNNPEPAKKGYVLPVTINVTRQGDEATTRATYNESTKKLSFSAGDKLLVWGSASGAGKFASTLDYVPASGQFSGTITTENSYSGDAEALFTAASTVSSIEVDLLPAGYETYHFLSINNSGYEAALGYAPKAAFATSKATAVEQFSYETSYAYNNGFALRPENAILNFTITGLTANATGVAVALTGSSSPKIEGSVTTDVSGNATFAVGVKGGTDLANLTLTVGGYAIALANGSKTLTAGKIYSVTRSANPVAPEGAIDSKFSVSSTRQVYFAKGNLRATTSDGGATWTWSFATNQWSAIINNAANNAVSGNGKISSTDGTVDLFGWSTSATTYGIHNSTYSNAYSGDFVDWGNLPITNGGNTANSGWRTLSGDEWKWLLGPTDGSADPGTNCRKSSTVNGVENARFAKAMVNNKPGIIIFPDSYTHPTNLRTPNNINKANAAYDDDNNYYSSDSWQYMENAGCVFLPAGGGYVGNTNLNSGTGGYYWSSTSASETNAYAAYYICSTNNPETNNRLSPKVSIERSYRYSVRLVKNVQ